MGLAILFDIDGVLVDSEPLHDEVLQLTLAEVQGPQESGSSLDHIGLSFADTLAVLGVPTEMRERVQKRYIDLYCSKVTAALLREGVVDAWRELTKRGIPFGCVTSAERRVALANLETLKDIATPQVIAREDVTETKPNPAPYQELAARLGFDPADCIAVEDSDVGLTSAHRAGVGRRIAFPHGTSGGQSYDLAHNKINRLSEILEFI